MTPGRLTRRLAAALLLVTTPIAAALAQTAPHPGRLGGGGALDLSLGRIVISFVICVIIAALAILLIRQRGGKIDLAAFVARLEPRARRIRVAETRRLSPHADICLVSLDGVEFLLLLQHGSAVVLREGPSDVADSATPCA